MREALSIIIIIMSIVLTTLIVVQSKGNDLSGFLGGSGESEVKHTRRGVEAMLYNFTVILSVVFFIVCVLAFFAWGL